MTFIVRNFLSLLCLMTMIGFSLILYGSLPEQVPSQYSFAGEVQETMPRWLMVILLPTIYMAVIAFINILIRISPSKFSMPHSKMAMDIIVLGIGVLLLSIHAALLIGNGDADIFQKYFAYGMATFMIITGNVFGKTERNFFVGLKTPWTIASNLNWKMTHRLAGEMMVVFGLILFISNYWFSHAAVTLVLSLAPVIIAAVYSPYYYLKYERGGESVEAVAK